MKTIILFLFFLSLPTYSAEKLKKHLDQVDKGDLSQILKKRYLRILTTRNPYDYYIYQGRSKGLQYEMAREFTKYLNRKFTGKKQLRIVFEIIPVDFDQLIPMLEAGKGDIIAVGMTKTAEREKQIAFTRAYREVDEVIVTRKELAKQPWQGKTFHTQENSSFHKSLLKHQKKHKLNVQTVDPNWNFGDVMELVSLGKYDYSLVNSFWAETIGKGFKNLKVLKTRAFRRNIGVHWAVRKGNKRLLRELNTFLPKVKKGSLLGNMFSYKYFHDVSRIGSKDFNLKTSTLSKYDDLIKKYAKKYGFDWRWLASVAYQESRFNQKIKNKWGAIGMFQVKQKTANEPYINIKQIDGEKNVENNIHAGAKYLAWIKNRYFDSRKGMSEEARLRMTLAAYNAGPRRVRQAIAKARRLKLNSKKWFRHVEVAMLKRGYPEPVLYVSEINKHYVSYLLLGIK